MHSPPGSQIDSSRAAMLTPSPKMSLPSMMMSPILMPMRKTMRLSSGTSVLSFDHAALNGDGAGHRVDHAGEFRQQPVAGGFDDAAAMGGDCAIDQVLADGLERAQGADFVGAHQPAIADDVRRQNRGEPALNVLVLCQTERFHR